MLIDWERVVRLWGLGRGLERFGEVCKETIKDSKSEI